MSQSTRSLKVTIIDRLVSGQTDQWDGNGEHHPFALISWGSLALLLWFFGSILRPSIFICVNEPFPHQTAHLAQSSH